MIQIDSMSCVNLSNINLYLNIKVWNFIFSGKCVITVLFLYYSLLKIFITFLFQYYQYEHVVYIMPKVRIKLLYSNKYNHKTNILSFDELAFTLQWP